LSKEISMEDPMIQLLEEVQRFSRIKSGAEPLYSPEHLRSYPDRHGCEYFDDAEEARKFFEGILTEDQNGYVVLTNIDGDICASPLPNPSPDAKPIPGWVDIGSRGFVRVGDDYWEWVDDNASVWLCSLCPKLLPPAYMPMPRARLGG
jgi:hypothetical protein